MDNENQVHASEEAQVPWWKERNFESEDKVAEALDKYSQDVRGLKDSNKQLREQLREFESMKAEQEAKRIQELQDVESLRAELQKARDEHSRTLEEVSKREQMLVYERNLQTALQGRPEGQSKILRKLLDAQVAQGFESEESLKSLIKTTIKEFDESLANVIDPEKQPRVGPFDRGMKDVPNSIEQWKALQDSLKLVNKRSKK